MKRNQAPFHEERAEIYSEIPINHYESIKRLQTFPAETKTNNGRKNEINNNKQCGKVASCEFAQLSRPD